MEGIPATDAYRIFWMFFNIIVLFGVVVYIFYLPYLLNKILKRLDEIEQKLPDKE